MVHFFALLFWAAGALALVGGLPQLGAAIFVVILLNGVFAFVQQQRAEHATERLRDLLPRLVSVIRDGRPMRIPAADLVTGDLVMLSEGDRISADLLVTEAHALLVDTSTLTGESVPAALDEGDPLYAGCFVVEGEGRGVVVGTADDTRLASIARLTTEQHAAPSPLRRELDRVSRIIALVAVAVGSGFFAVALLGGTPAADGFVFAIGVTVAVVPCGLLPTVTLSLAMGAQRMADRDALVRHLEGVETLGSTTFICTDKTGTLTRNEMSVVDVWMPSGSVEMVGEGYEPEGEARLGPGARLDDLVVVARAARRCSNGRLVRADDAWVPHGDPMEVAIDVLGRRVGYDWTTDVAEHPEQARFPFDARRRRMSVIVDGEVLVKGAPDSVFPRCRSLEGAPEALDALAKRGLRVLAVARRDLGGVEPEEADDAEVDLELVGLLAFEDPPRRNVKVAVDACRNAGIRLAMVTGDHPETAFAIAAEVGFDRDAAVVLGDDLPDDLVELGELIDRDCIVIARVSPEGKLRIAQALQARGHVVAMTGDGVNDAPALREAAIGVAMGCSGTDVAREAADLVLLDDNFATIVAAIEQGRSTFLNIRRFLTYHLTDNVAELAPFVVWALSGARIPLAIGVLQVLALDIGTDVLPALALGAEPPSAGVLDRPPVQGHLLDRTVFARAFGVLGPVEALVEMAAFIGTFLAFGWRPGQTFPHGTELAAASGAAFTAVVFGQVANAFACRSVRWSVWQVPLGRNRLLLGAIAAELGMLLAFLFVGPLARLLGQAPPTVVGTAVALLAVPAVVLADAMQKAVVRRRPHARGRSVLGAA
jgi:magnesium-transporting ATPase (P-type)